MTRVLGHLFRWLCDPAKLEFLEGDLEERYGAEAAERAPRIAWRYAWDLLSLCVHHSRFAGAGWPRRAASLALILSLAAVLALRTRRDLPPPHYTVNATDPAGSFTLEIRDRRVVAATLNGDPIDPARLVQSENQLWIRGGDGGRDFRIAIKPTGGIIWEARQQPERR